MAIPLLQAPPMPGVTGLAVGVFDGVHLGHRAILAEARHGGGEGAHGQTAALTFDPHPMVHMAPEKAPSRLSTAAQRTALLLDSRGGTLSRVDAVLTIAFNEALQHLPAERFLEEIVRIFPNLRRIASGPDWKFGQGRRGDAALIAGFNATHGFPFRAFPVPAVLHGGSPISSTRVREAIRQRDFAETAAMLGREYDIEGLVGHGAGRGSGIGFPTANVGGIAQLLPPPGVYACRVTVNGESHRAVANHGSNPTFGPDTQTHLEVHLLDFKKDLYGATLKIDAFRFLRDERKFSSVEALIAQIGADVATARTMADSALF
ncbi:FMN adenylyltransferase /riboflavin kinase [Verrucomicrobium sp. GAS474]|uniref:riboflavin biosynthesis protein RibF n=1 Tax=Verrucomicrobium sp. GAS474 TaxID=1882831 RepID=UPI000879DEA8|nr:riboflavin biosynthesis protein RibF [Verrucomicrobium sp. GAS474]SDT91814.1 FMN adenylyltransferase /riboflavin kinase [Verrucomicrobium sp. GAS474]